MRHPEGFSPHIRLFIRMAARIVLLAIVIQIAAPDHWHRDVSSVVGVENTQQHAMHCHGASSGCGDSGGMTALTVTPVLLALASSPVVSPTEPSLFSPIEAFLSQPDQPPRAA
jgi:hypothetical protein